MNQQGIFCVELMFFIVDMDRAMAVREGLGKSMAEMERNRMTSTQAHQSPQAYRSNQPPPGHSLTPDLSRLVSPYEVFFMPSDSPTKSVISDQQKPQRYP